MFNENGVVFSEKFLKGEGGMCFAAVLAFLVYSFERETVNYFRIFRGNKKNFKQKSAVYFLQLLGLNKRRNCKCCRKKGKIGGFHIDLRALL